VTKKSISIPPVKAWLDPVTREAVVMLGDVEIIRDKLDDLEWERKKRKGWKVKYNVKP